MIRFKFSSRTMLAIVVIGLFIAGTVLVTPMLLQISAHGRDVLLAIAIVLLCVLIAQNLRHLSRFESSFRKFQKSAGSSNDLDYFSKELYIELYKNSPVPYLMINSEGNIRSANIAAVRLLNTTTRNAIGTNVFEYLKSDEPNHMSVLIEKYQKGVAMSDELVRVQRPGEQSAWALMSLFSYVNAEQGHIGLLTLVDITKQKNSEDAKTEFVSLASHQLRTPIAGIKWSAELLQMDNPDGLTVQQHKYIDRLLDSVNRMARLIDDFLRVSRFELGTFQPEYVPTDLTKLFEQVVQETGPRAAQKGIEVKTFFDPNVGTIFTDANLVRMIVSNIHGNAIKYTREKGTVHIGFRKVEDTINISIADNGMGIPSADQDQVFSKLFRARNAVRDVPDGTGLGLYIVRQAVDVLKGKISFTSVQDMGTTFEIVIPYEEPPVAYMS